jgi:23S rRNA pseudouridine2604 synthase
LGKCKVVNKDSNFVKKHILETSINKYISDSGFCSRREADKLIEQFRVEINGSLALKGNRVQQGDVVTVDGEKLKTNKKVVYIALYKPRGITTTTDTTDKNNVISFINYKSRIFPVGRLDRPSEGLLLLTNDGDMVNKILRAGNQHEKEYVVTVEQEITNEFLQKMRNGIKIDGVMTKNCKVEQLGKNKFKIILVQGLYRQIRKMCEACNYHVTQLIRTRIMHITIKNLPNGKWRYLTQEEINKMEEMVKGSSKAPK